MTKYLKIENPGVCPEEGFILLGASSKSGSKSPYCIGQFGSGNKHAAGVLLRAELPPVVFCSNHKLTFTTERGVMSAVEGRFIYDRIVIQHGGRDETGRSRSGREPLSQTSNYGVIDWEDIEMALREYVSNAIDATINYNELKGVQHKYPFVGVEIAIVDESEVKAKKGFTRVFVPLSSDKSMHKHEEAITKFYENIGKWFLHFSEPWSINSAVLPKKNRNIGTGKTAVIYRRGVRVREIAHYYGESLFDYNLNNIRVDESRNIDDYVACSAAAKAMSNAEPDKLACWLKSFESPVRYWEHGFEGYNLRAQYDDTAEITAAREKNWATAAKAIGDNVVVCAKGAPKQTLGHKGYKVLEVPEAVAQAAGQFGLDTPEKVLTTDERDGRVICEATPDATECCLLLWEKIVAAGMHANKDMPIVQCFRTIMSGGSQCLGFQRGNTVYVSESIAKGMSKELQQTMLEEIAHYITGALDETRDLQDWAFGAAIAFLNR